MLISTASSTTRSSSLKSSLASCAICVRRGSAYFLASSLQVGLDQFKHFLLAGKQVFQISDPFQGLSLLVFDLLASPGLPGGVIAGPGWPEPAARSA